jgi:hypothetical protein
MFYERVLTGEPIGKALLARRKGVFKLGQRDWADYILCGNFGCGNFGFVLKRRRWLEPCHP